MKTIATIVVRSLVFNFSLGFYTFHFNAFNGT
jgi:hypothetical protein